MSLIATEAPTDTPAPPPAPPATTMATPPLSMWILDLSVAVSFTAPPLLVMLAVEPLT
jgi:hypothetical protein